MKTRILSVDKLETAAQIISNGGMVAIPTDTVYGLAISSADTTAIEKLREAKGRPEDKPFPMMVSNTEQLKSVAVISARERKVIEAFMPGALTIVFRKKDSLPAIVTSGFPTVGIRMPDDNWVLRLIEMVGCPLLVPSANLSGEPSCTNHWEVLQQLEDKIDAVVEGESGALLASTIVDMSGVEIKLIRQGIITIEEIMEVVNAG